MAIASMRSCGGHYLVLAMLFLSPSITWGDGGTLRFAKQRDGYRITLFTAPMSLRAGPVDFSVLVQSARSEAPLPDVLVTIEAYPVNEPRKRTRGIATSAAATNKLFKAVQLELPQAGLWHVEVAIGTADQLIRADTELDVGEPLPSWVELAPWIGWPAAAIVLFAIHQWLARRRRRNQ